MGELHSSKPEHRRELVERFSLGLIVSIDPPYPWGWNGWDITSFLGVFFDLPLFFFRVLCAWMTFLDAIFEKEKKNHSRKRDRKKDRKLAAPRALIARVGLSSQTERSIVTSLI